MKILIAMISINNASNKTTSDHNDDKFYYDNDSHNHIHTPSPPTKSFPTKSP